jgi:BirA family biotin operon repressor/biotin-[acetyl-CoA-carboxylase] ligase
MSIIIKPTMDIKEIAKISPLTGLCIQRALSESTDMDVGIKWPNDIIINKKKVCGILVESIIENEEIKCIIIGIGVNVNQEQKDFTHDLEHASSLKIQKGQAFLREDVICKILYCFEKYYDEFLKTKILDIKELIRTSVIINKKVTVVLNSTGESIIGNVVGFLNDGSILVKDENDQIININSSKVSIRGINSYLD